MNHKHLVTLSICIVHAGALASGMNTEDAQDHAITFVSELLDQITKADEKIEAYEQWKKDHSV